MNTIYPKPKQEVLYKVFDELQKKLTPLWEQIGGSDPGGDFIERENTLVVLPSLTTDLEFDVASQQGYEERMLFMLFLLRQPHVRVVYLTSVPIPQETIDYYLDILPSVTISNARKRLTIISPQDSSSRPLVVKLLERPHLMQQIRNSIPDMNMAHLVPFLTTDLERDFAVQLGIPMYAADPRFFAFGTKSGCRQVFAEENVQHPLGQENLKSKTELAKAIAGMRAKKPSMQTVIVKQNDNVSGWGNATLDLSSLPEAGSADEVSIIEEHFQNLELTADDSHDHDWYFGEIEKKGGIVEELISGEEFTSPSVQLRITPLGDVEILSTHDQMLGGPSGQIYLGARFPAKPEYAVLIADEARKIGERFAREGIMGRFALDFIAVRDKNGKWDTYAIEVNLRKGGTTHPFLTLQFLTGGKYNAGNGEFKTAQGIVKHYVATDALKSDAYKNLTPSHVFDALSEHRLHFDHTKHTGVVLHMLNGISTLGKIGFTAIGNTPEHADEIYQQFIKVLDEHSAKVK